jgi:glyoxylase-like metal-dependent hydrolase (beta-lactamase superfamily II)
MLVTQGSGAAGEQTRWRITALDTGTSHLDQSMLTYTVGVGQVVRIPRVMWLVEGPTTVVVDTSVPMRRRPSEFIQEEFTRSAAQVPANALRDAGVDPRDVEFVVLTHLHWDHAGNCDLFSDARVIVQRDELRYAIDPGRFFRKSFLSPASGWGTPPWLLPNIDTVEGETELAPGLRLVPTPGHTPGSQALIADTEFGSFCIAGDAISLYANIEQDIPPGFHVDVDDAVESMDRLRSLADHFLPSHDYEVLSQGRITPIGPTHASRPRYVPRPVEPWDPEPDETLTP